MGNTHHVRQTPKQSVGGIPLGEPWEGVPADFQKLRVPEFTIPQTPYAWQRRRPEIEQIVLECLGEMPPRPDPLDVRTIRHTEQEHFIEEHFEFHNGVDACVPGILNHFDSEAIIALIAPRPLLMLSGREDYILPFDGIEIFEEKVGGVYTTLGVPEKLRSVIYDKTGHEYLPEMQEEMLTWFERYLKDDE